MVLYVVTTHEQAARIRREGFPEYGRYFALTEDGEISRVQRPRFSNLSWHAVSDFAGDELPRDWEELAVEFPAEAVAGYETVSDEGGNRVWYIPPDVATHYLRKSPPLRP